MTDREYFEQRAIMAMELATRAEDERAAAAHAAMAAEYFRRLRTGATGGASRRMLRPSPR